jgi:hypothetical protein
MSLEKGAAIEGDLQYFNAAPARRFEFMYRKSHGLAYLLDPRFIGEVFRERAGSSWATSSLKYQLTTTRQSVILDERSCTYIHKPSHRREAREARQYLSIQISLREAQDAATALKIGRGLLATIAADFH